MTLTGVGGVGKTRLALELARRAAAEHGGVYFVPLAGVAAGEGAADLVLASVLQALREPVAQIEPLRDQVVRALESRQAVGGPLLLVLDNFEHLLPGGAAPGAGAATPGDPTETVAFLLECAPHLRCLVTSRRPLGLLGERVVPLAPLAVPFPGWEWERVRDSPSVRLFVERARVRQVDFAVTPRNAAPLAEICAAVEGLPLAIELAAARAYLVPVSEMLAHLQTRFEFLIEPTRGRPVRDARHSALRNTIAWSYRLLAPPLRELFARLSVFRGFDSATAAAVLEADATEAARGIEELRACSLVEAAPGAEGRFRMLDAVREFAAGELAASEAAALRQRHAEHFLGVARRAIEAARGPEQGLWLDRLEAEVDNVRAALAASLETETGLRLTSALHHYWYVRGHLGEGRRWMRRALEACPDPPDQVLSSTLNALGVFAWTQGDFGEAEQCFGEALAVRERTGDRIGVAGLQNNMGSLAQQRGDLGTARARLDASIALYRELNRSHQLAHALYNRASVAVDGGESEHALALLTESLELAEAGGDRYALANGHQLRAVVALLGGGDTGAAARDLAAALEARRELKDRRSLPGTLVWAAALSARRGDPMRAARLLGAASELRARLSALLSPSEERAFAGEVAAAQAALSPDAFAVAWEEGTAFSPDQAVLYVLAGLPLAGGGTEKIY